MQQLTDKATLESLLRFAGKGDVRYYLNGIQCGADRMRATDGHRFMECNYSDIDPADFPVTPTDPQPVDGAILDRDMVADAIKAARPNRQFPALDNTILITRDNEREATMTCHNGSRTQTVSDKLIDGKWPNLSLSQFEPDGATFTATAVDPDYLIDLGTALKKMGLGVVQLRIRSDAEGDVPLLFEAGDRENPRARGLIMPKRR